MDDIFGTLADEWGDCVLGDVLVGLKAWNECCIVCGVVEFGRCGMGEARACPMGVGVMERGAEAIRTEVGVTGRKVEGVLDRNDENAEGEECALGVCVCGVWDRGDGMGVLIFNETATSTMYTCR